jgi:hypothetical protein
MRYRGSLARTQARRLDQSAEPVDNTREEFTKILRPEVALRAEIVKLSGAKSD